MSEMDKEMQKVFFSIALIQNSNQIIILFLGNLEVWDDSKIQLRLISLAGS